MKLHKKINKILPILADMLEQKDNLLETIEKREEVFNNRSEKWQESEKGIAHEEKTPELNDLHFEIEDRLETIETALHELLEITEE